MDPSKKESCNLVPTEEESITKASEESSGEGPIYPNGTVEGRCEDLADGFFEHAPCSSYFLTCSGGVARVMSCPSHLIYDKKLKICNYAKDVEGCRQITMHCPARLVFDEGRQLCDYPKAVDVCEGSGEHSGEGSGEWSGLEYGSGEASGELGTNFFHTGEVSGEFSGDVSGELSGSNSGVFNNE
ncbi:unnamed protein product, partial [Strongylus vulgaris]